MADWPSELTPRGALFMVLMFTLMPLVVGGAVVAMNNGAEFAGVLLLVGLAVFLTVGSTIAARPTTRPAAAPIPSSSSGAGSPGVGSSGVGSSGVGSSGVASSGVAPSSGAAGAGRPGPAGSARPQVAWAAARADLDRVAREYAEFESDPGRVLGLPALADVTVPSTARFVDAFAAATALATDRYPEPGHAARFVTAVAAADRTWLAAGEAAERIGHSRLAAAERGAVERVRKLLTTAHDSDSEPERLAAYALARDELTRLDRTGVVRVPPAAFRRTAIEPPPPS